MSERPSNPGDKLRSAQGISEGTVHGAPRFLCGGDSYQGESAHNGADTDEGIGEILRSLKQALGNDTSPEEIMAIALELVSGARASQHGDYRELHDRVAKLWSVYLGVPVRGSQVAFCMALLKGARDEKGSFNSDDGVDATAYIALWAALTDDEQNSA